MLAQALLLGLLGCGDIDADLALEADALETSQPLVAPACSSRKLDEVLAPAVSGRSVVKVNCSLSLPASARVTKAVVIEGAAASGVRLACNGATLANGLSIRSVKQVDASTGMATWLRPIDVEVQGCTVYGMVRVYGMATNGEGVDLRDSSRQPGHTRRAQGFAPKRITLRDVHLVGTGRIPLYVGPGVTQLSLLDSEVSGESESVAIYLDAESGWNTIARNYVHTATGDGLFTTREVMAVDGSANNQIAGNLFSALNHGGIYLYRNCGEGGTIRHQAPLWNQIIDNVFFYNAYDGELPAIWIASRNGNRPYCSLDAGYPFGSSVNDADLAQHTVVAQNRFHKFEPASMIRLGSALPQYVFANETTTTSASRPSGCLLVEQLRFLEDGASASTFNFAGASPVCTGKEALCDDGSVSLVAGACPSATVRSFACSANGNDAGCAVSVACPDGEELVSVKAACNLETDAVAENAVDALRFGTVSVLRASDNVRDGHCVIGGQDVQSGAARLITQGTLGAAGFVASCRERDRNGGDCKVLGRYWCARL